MTPRPVRAFLVAVVVAFVSATYLSLSEGATDYGEAFLLIIGGLPVAAGICAVAFHLAGSPAFVGTALLWLVLWMLPRWTADLDPPLAIWPVVLGAIAGGFVALTGEVMESRTLRDAGTITR